jgi:hypothetical protein
MSPLLHPQRHGRSTDLEECRQARIKSDSESTEFYTPVSPVECPQFRRECVEVKTLVEHLIVVASQAAVTAVTAIAGRRDFPRDRKNLSVATLRVNEELS